jgi:hypothetical protein
MSEAKFKACSQSVSLREFNANKLSTFVSRQRRAETSGGKLYVKQGQRNQMREAKMSRSMPHMISCPDKLSAVKTGCSFSHILK